MWPAPSKAIRIVSFLRFGGVARPRFYTRAAVSERHRRRSAMSESAMGTPAPASAATIRRCSWCGDDPLYVGYHDHEWGFPVADDVRLFEKICLEGFQAG